jgi:hypothetical protein
VDSAEDIRKKFRKLSIEMSRRYTRSFDKSGTLPVCPKDRAATTLPLRNSDEKCRR